MSMTMPLALLVLWAVCVHGCMDSSPVAPRGAWCGNGVLDADEVCDDGNQLGGDGCSADCASLEVCGDGITDRGAGEACDDGNQSGGDGCSADCSSLEICGDEIVDPGIGEECDDGNNDDSDDCTAMCEAADCTDGIMNADELDVDCGGHCGPGTCLVGQMCVDDGDCSVGSCRAGMCKVVETDIVTGLEHTCALDSAGAVRCWGRNNDGQLGYGHTNNIGDDELPSMAGTVDVGGVVEQLAAGQHHTCALLQGGAVRCWGDNFYGQLGYGHTDNIGDNELPSTAGDVSLGGTAVQVVAGFGHTCALLQNGAVRCWGYNVYGQLGYGNSSTIGDDELPATAGDIDLGGVAEHVVAGGDHTCALLQGGTMRCWGYNDFGQLGYGHDNWLGDNELPATAGDVPLGDTILQMTAGDHHTCALLQGGTVYCWGWNISSQLGYGQNNDIGDNELPTAEGTVMIGDTATRLVTGERHTCARLQGGGIRCWGSNYSGQLGQGHTSDIGDDELPSSVNDISVGSAVAHMAEGHGRHNCVRLQSGGVRCWGRNNYGQLGLGHTDNIGDDEPPSSVGEVPYE